MQQRRQVVDGRRSCEVENCCISSSHVIEMMSKQTKDRILGPLLLSVPDIIQCKNYYTEEIRNRDCWHIRSHSTPTAVSKRILNDISLVAKAEIAPLCKACTFCFVPSLGANAVEVLSAPFAVHYPLSKFVYHHTELWKWSVYDILAVLNTHRVNPQSNGHLAHRLRCLVKHLPFLRANHYQFLMTDTKFVDELCRFVLREIDGDLGGSAGFYVFLILCYLLRWYIDSQHSDTSVKTFHASIGNVRKLAASLRAHSNLVNHGMALMLCEFRKTAKIVDKTTKKLWRKERKHEKCQNGKCRQMRKSRGKRKESEGIKKWMLCSSCLVTEYCSRECAKRDWKFGHHKLYCNSFGRLRGNIISVKMSRARQNNILFELQT